MRGNMDFVKTPFNNLANIYIQFGLEYIHVSLFIKAPPVAERF